MRSRRSVPAPGQQHDQEAGPKQPFAAVPLPDESRMVRDPRKLRLLRWSSPLIALIAVAGIWLISLFLWTTWAATRPFSEASSRLVSTYENQELVTAWFPQPWLGKYNLGTVLLAQGETEAGVDLLESALQLVPKARAREDGQIEPFTYECAVRSNLSAGIEMLGDVSTEAGDEAGATAAYERALKLVEPCEMPSSGSGESAGQDGDGDSEEPAQGGAGTGQESEPQGNQAGDRLREKLGQEPQNQGGEDPQGGEGAGTPENEEFDPNSNPFEGETPEQKERREELEQKARDQAEREREREESGGRGSGSGW